MIGELMCLSAFTDMRKDRMESGRALPSGSTLKRFARATGTRLRITFEPARPPKRARA